MDLIHSEDSLDSYSSVESQNRKGLVSDDNDDKVQVVDDGSTCDTIISNLGKCKMQTQQTIKSLNLKNQISCQVNDMLAVSEAQSMKTTPSSNVSTEKDQRNQTVTTQCTENKQASNTFRNKKKNYACNYTRRFKSNYGHYKNRSYGQQSFHSNYYPNPKNRSNYYYYNSKPYYASNNSYPGFSLPESPNKWDNYYKYGPFYQQMYSEQELYEERMEKRFYLISKFMDLLYHMGL